MGVEALDLDIRHRTTSHIIASERPSALELGMRLASHTACGSHKDDHKLETAYTKAFLTRRHGRHN